MIFILNREYVVWEVVELARLHMCEVLKVPPTAIEATLELNPDSGTLSPEFQIDADLCAGVKKNDIRKVMEKVYEDCKREMLERLEMCEFSRKQYLEKFVWNDEEQGTEASTA